MGTGSIFGFIVARQAYDSAILPPMFIIMSFAYGLAFFILVLMFVYDQDKRPLGDVMLFKLKNLLGVFVAAVFFMTLMYHLTKLYGTKNLGVESFILIDGGIYTAMFWVGWVLVGCLVPLGIVYHPVLGKDRNWIAAACAMVILGGFATLYVIVIGGQAYPLPMFPGSTILESGFADGVNGAAAWYLPSIPEILLGFGGIAVALFITAVGVRVLQFLPESLADAVVDPHLAVKE
jgi:molybdopterin-containing oxidoreductase family membrane subunit